MCSYTVSDFSDTDSLVLEENESVEGKAVHLNAL